MPARSSSKQGFLGELSAEIEFGDSCQQICQQIDLFLLAKLLTEALSTNLSTD